MGQESILAHYSLNFNMMQHHKYSLTELEGMLPWERDLYVSLLEKFIEEENKRINETKG